MPRTYDLRLGNWLKLDNCEKRCQRLLTAEEKQNDLLLDDNMEMDEENRVLIEEINEDDVLFGDDEGYASKQAQARFPPLRDEPRQANPDQPRGRFSPAQGRQRQPERDNPAGAQRLRQPEQDNPAGAQRQRPRQVQRDNPAGAQRQRSRQAQRDNPAGAQSPRQAQGDNPDGAQRPRQAQRQRQPPPFRRTLPTMRRKESEDNRMYFNRQFVNHRGQIHRGHRAGRRLAQRNTRKVTMKIIIEQESDVDGEKRSQRDDRNSVSSRESKLFRRFLPMIPRDERQDVIILFNKS
ncbi:octapeptide-repeat protein T2 [Diachasma alloeum]|uniref:octapeptide-repeat protein T2 n=1 Tax=Diachasma alloeum TaxID=454923 RepID=UPI00073840F9|nr:octapeptide-repeat protein T2 [Diachasma alloeum]